MLQETRANRTFGTVKMEKGSLRGLLRVSPGAQEGCLAVAGADGAVCWGLPRSGKEDPTGCNGAAVCSYQEACGCSGL